MYVISSIVQIGHLTLCLATSGQEDNTQNSEAPIDDFVHGALGRRRQAR